MTGTFQRFEVTHGSFGEQHTTIDGVEYLTWFDLMDLNLKGLEAGAVVEYEARPGPTLLCDAPQVRSRLASARLVRVIGPRADAYEV
ncbi:MAG TPA: hypothetical protein VG146_22005 [Verrucomicrobiae bacterium]|nr:hypothetical protein [Verrucomicrobiae bacterium]